jgi:hypothetical protein
VHVNVVVGLKKISVTLYYNDCVYTMMISVSVTSGAVR